MFDTVEQTLSLYLMPSDSAPQLLPNHITQLRCGLGWDAQGETELDLDMAVLALADNGKLVDGQADVIYAGHPRHQSGAIQLLNDSITGEGDGDDEQLLIRLLALPTEITKLLFVVTIDCGEEQQQDFRQAENAFWRIFDKTSRRVLLRCSLSNPQWQGVTLLLIATLERVEAQWRLVPCLAASQFHTLNELLHEYYVPD
ncbi:MAG: TerD family protein [Cyanobacteria bacterium P01_D01_bin.156]